MKFLFLLLSFCASFYLKAQKEITNWYDAERKQKKEVFFDVIEMFGFGRWPMRWTMTTMDHDDNGR